MEPQRSEKILSDLVELQCVCKLRISSFENRIARNMSNFLSEIPTLSIQAINPSAPHPTPYRVPSSDVFCKQLALASEILATRLASWIGLRAGSLIFLRRNVFQNPMDIIGFIQVPTLQGLYLQTRRGKDRVLTSFWVIFDVMK